MRVALLGYLYGLGGIQNLTRRLAEQLVVRGHDVCVVTPPAISESHTELNVPEGCKLTEYRSWLDVYNGFGLRGWADVIVVAGTGYKAMIGALRTGAQCKKVYFEVTDGVRRNRLDPRMLIHAGFDVVLGQGSPVEARLCKEFNWNGASKTIPALSLELPAPDMERKGPITGDIRAAYFGRLTKLKNAAYLVERWRELGPNATLDIWGVGSDSDRIAEIIKAEGLSELVKLKGVYPNGVSERERMIDYVKKLKEYDLTLLPTVSNEGAPLVLLESMSVGVPFVANGVGGIPDYNNEDCRVTSGDLDEFLPMLHEMIERLRRGEIDNSRLQRHFRQNYSNAVLTDRWEDFLENLVGSH